MANVRNVKFKCVKITLIVIHVLSLIVLSIGLILTIGLLILANSDIVSTNANSSEGETAKNAAQTASAIAFLIALIPFVLEIVCLVAVIKEYKWIVTTFAVIYVIGIIFGFVVNGFGLKIIGVIITLIGITLLTVIYAHMLFTYENLDEIRVEPFKGVREELETRKWFHSNQFFKQSK